MSTAILGNMQRYGQYCPLARGAEVLGDRWTLLIIREMLFGVQRFNELERFLPGISRSVLAQRLRHLQRVGLVERHADADGQRSLYLLTQAGRDLRPVVRAIGNWGAKWAFGDPDPAELDPDLVVQWISRHLAWERLPARRVVVQFAVTGPPVRRYWLVIQPEDVSVCMHDPGFGVDAVFRSDARTLYQVYTGELALPDAQRSGRLQLDCAPAVRRQVPTWFAWSGFAPSVREGMAQRTANPRAGRA
jgi:DNA-binding HxlR family transcriptional regulator